MIKLKNFSILFLLLFAIPSVCYPQAQLYGRLIDENTKKALSSASVVLEDRLHKPICFVQSGEDGAFKLNVPDGKDGCYITISMLGYAKQTISAANFKNGSIIYLTEEEFQLKEVKISSKRLKSQGDTIIYSVAGFRQKQDRSIADVISKLPGLEVEANGSIKYQGKAISNFYIEGLDLMGGNYSLASENLNASKVKEVQVLTNHQQIKSLRGVLFSEEAALNLVLEKDAKNTWIGLCELGLGMTLQESDADMMLRDGRLMAMAFGEKMQSLSMYKWNNTGRNIKNEVRDLTFTTNTVDDIPNMTTPIGFSVYGISPDRYLMNDSRVIATNWLRKVASDATLRLQVKGFIDETEGCRQTETIYSDAMGAPVINEEIKGLSKSSELKGELKYERNGSALYIANILSGYWNYNKGVATTQINGQGTYQQSIPRELWINNDLKVVRTLRDNRLLSLNASAGYIYLPGSLMLTDSSKQIVNQHATKASLSLQFRHKFLDRLFISYHAGIEFRDQRFKVFRTEWSRQDDYQQLVSYIEPSVNLQRKNFKWTGSFPLRLYHRTYSQQSQVKAVVEPSCSFEYQMTSMLKLRASYLYRWQPAMLNEMTGVPLYINYLSYSTGISTLLATGNHVGIFRMEYTNTLHNLFGNIDLSYSYHDKLPLYNTFLDGLMYHREATGDYADNSSWTMGGRIGKSLFVMKSISSINGKMTRIYSTALMRGDRLRYQSDIYQIGLNFSLSPHQFVSFEESSDVQYSKSICITNPKLDGKSICYFHHNLKTFLFPQNWQIEWTNEIFHSNDDSVTFNYFSNLHISYISKQYEISLHLNNIWGNKEYERCRISSYATTYTYYKLRPREFIIKFTFNY